MGKCILKNAKSYMQNVQQELINYIFLQICTSETNQLFFFGSKKTAIIRRQQQFKHIVSVTLHLNHKHFL